MSLTFADPKFFWLCTLLPLFPVLKVLSDLRGESLLRRAVAPRLMEQLRERGGAIRGWCALGLEMLAMLGFITALARPQYGFTEEKVVSSGRSLLIAVDTSRSMLADDLPPNRLERAKFTVRDMVSDLPTDRIGLIAFAGKAYLQVPLTQDHEGLVEMLDQTDTELIPRGGTNVAAAIDLAVETFTGQKKGEEPSADTISVGGKAALLLFSDGDELEGQAVEAAQRAAEKGILVITVGVGTKSGGFIPDPETRNLRYVRDENGKEVRTALHEEVLVKIARATGGMYLPLMGSDLTKVVDRLQSSENKSQTMKRPIERYRYPLCASLLFLAGALATRMTRRSASRMLPAIPVQSVTAAWVAFALLLAATGVASAKDAIDPLLKDAQDLYAEKKYEESVTAYEQALDLLAPEQKQLARLGLGAAAMQAGEFDKANTTFGHSLLGPNDKAKELGHYNLANSIFEHTRAQLAKRKELTELELDALITVMRNCIEHYDETLALNKDHKSAQSNRAKVEQFLRRLLDSARESAKQQQQKMDGQQKNEMVKAMENLKEHYEQEIKKEPADAQEAQNKKDVEEFIKQLQGKDQPGKEGQEGKEGEEGKKGEDGKQGEDGKGEDKPGDKGKGDKEGKEGEGKEGEKKEEKEDGKPKEDTRTEAEKEAEKKANEAANKKMDGQVKAAGDEKGKEEKAKKALAAKDEKAKKEEKQKMGAARAALRQQLEKYSEEKMIRPRMEEAESEEPYKNW